MKRTTAALIAMTVVLGVSSVANAKVIWRGDFETGDISQWNGTEMVSPDRLRVVSDPATQGKYALKTVVKQGDDPINASGNRNELIYVDDRPQEGEDRYYRWQTLVPSTFKTTDYWHLFTQWHQYKTGGSPPLAFMVWGEEIKLGSGSNYFFSIPLERGIWQDWVCHVKWSSDPKVGGVEVWYNGKLILPFTHWATLFKNDTVYLKQGLYRKDLVSWDQTIYHDGMVVGTELDDVWPQTTAAAKTAASTAITTEKGIGLQPQEQQPATTSELHVGSQSCQSVKSGWAIPALAIALLSLVRRRGTRAR